MRKIILIVFLSICMLRVNSQNLNKNQFFNINGTVEIDTSSFKTIFIVPVGNSLVVTDINLNGSYTSLSLYRNNTEMINLDKKLWFHSCTGLLFKSGDKLMLYNENSAVSTNTNYNLIGYFIKQTK